MELMARSLLSFVQIMAAQVTSPREACRLYLAQALPKSVPVVLFDLMLDYLAQPKIVVAGGSLLGSPSVFVECYGTFSRALCSCRAASQLYVYPIPDPFTRDWVELESLPYGRVRPILSCQPQHVYALGGSGKHYMLDRFSFRPTAFVYSLRTGTWSTSPARIEVPGVDAKVTPEQCTAMPLNGVMMGERLYLVGTQFAQQALPQAAAADPVPPLFCFDLSTNATTVLPAPSFFRSDAGLCTMHDRSALFFSSI